MGWNSGGTKMARSALVLDASVGVKWFSDKGEKNIAQALAIKNGHLLRQLNIIVPDIFYYEVLNAIVKKAFIPLNIVRSATSALFDLGLNTYHMDNHLFLQCIEIARQNNVTVYDSSYIAIAKAMNCPLVTANPKHQSQELDCQIITIEKWQI
jgi:predicted nucleic acid-binding protein